MSEDSKLKLPEKTPLTPDRSRLKGSLAVQAAAKAEASRQRTLAEVLAPGGYTVAKQPDGKFVATEKRSGLVTKDTPATRTVDVTDMLQPGQTVVRYRAEGDNVEVPIVRILDSDAGAEARTMVRIQTTKGAEMNFDLRSLGQIEEGRGWLLPVPSEPQIGGSAI